MSFYTFLPKLLNMSLTASVAIALVILLRLFLKKSPKVISYALWSVVLFRLLCPVSVSSDFSLYQLFDAPTAESGTVTSIIEYVPSDIVHTESPAVTLPLPGVSDTINENLPQGEEQLRADPLEGPLFIATYLWMAGAAVMACCSMVSFAKLRRKLLVVVPLRDNIFIADDIKSPFVVGLLRPKIYLPCNLDAKEQTYIILHEQYHIKRFDHIIKALAFLALTIHWFNPLVWAAFILAGKDMEMSCDEAVIRQLGHDVRADYSASLLTLATGRRIIAGTPLAFGEGDTKGRILNLSRWKKPAAWVVALAAAACIILAVGLLTNPAVEREFPINGSNVSELDAALVAEKIAKAKNLKDGSQLYVNEDNFDLMFTPDFNWANDGAIRFFYRKDQKIYNAQLRMFHEDNKYFITDSSEWIEPEQIFLLIHYLEALKYMPQDAIRALSPDADGYSVMQEHDGTPGDYGRVLEYSQFGVGNTDGWNIHLTVQPLHKAADGGYHGRGDEVIHLFYDSQNPASESNSIINPSNIKSVTVDKVGVSEEAAKELISLINSHSCTSFQAGDDPNSLSRAIQLNCRSGDSYLLHYQYHKDSYRSILTFFPMEGKCKAWKMESDFDTKFSDWLAQYAFPHFGDFALNQPYGVVEVTYGNPLMSFHMVPQENSPEYMIDEAGQLFSVGEHSNAARWTKLGALQEVTITKENFDELIFSDSGLGWTDHASASEIRKNTFKAWSVIYDQDTLYYILQQYNGELYLASAYYDHAEKDDPHSDDTSIQWILKIAPDDTPIVPDTRTLDAAIRTAIIEVNTHTDFPDGLYHCASFVLLDKEEFSSTPVVGSTDHIGVVTVYGLALHLGYTLADNKPQEVEGSHIPVAITFHVKNGKYSLKEYWRPGDGSYYVPDIREKFPDEIEADALDTQKYMDAQMQECYAQATAYYGR